MPPHQRELAIRDVEQAMNNLERSSAALQDLAAKYGDIRPEHRDFCLTIVTALAELYAMLKLFRTKKM